jgi:hypothetical protein
MSAEIPQMLHHQLGPAAARLVRAAPEPWRSTARRRRFLFLAFCAPGFAAIAALPLHNNLWALLSGTLVIAVACLLRSLSEPLLILRRRW